VSVRVVAAADPTGFDEAVAAMERGEVIGIPTETVYGVCAVPLPESVERLIAAKQRSNEKGIQLLVDSLAQVRELAVVTPAAEQLAARFWPGGLTIVLERRSDIDWTPLLGGGRPTLGLRLPDHEVPRSLARRLGPIAASSANVSGQPDATNAQLVAQALGDVLTLIVDDGPVRGGTPSTVVECSAQDDPAKVLREGAISARQIADALR
jgi:tRNA threonylcarbamoyl adenosine modification protein (Sua5/YciO/YrdC/YwlC family)